jgi:K+-sensing histidine kinase KdpD
MTELTESPLALARADADALEMTMRPTDLNELARSVVEQSGAAAAEAGIELNAITPQQCVEATVDGLGIRRILLILAENAPKHTPAGGAVRVSVADRNSEIAVSVEEQGRALLPRPCLTSSNVSSVPIPHEAAPVSALAFLLPKPLRTAMEPPWK